MTIVSRTELGRELGKTQRQIEGLITKGLPVHKQADRNAGQAWEFDLEKCMDWYENYVITQELEEDIKRKEAEIESEESDALKRERIKQLQVQTARYQLRLDQERAELVPIESVAEAVEGQYASVRAQLLALPHKLAPLLAGITDIQEIDDIINSYINETLAELSSERVEERARDAVGLEDEDEQASKS